MFTGIFSFLESLSPLGTGKRPADSVVSKNRTEVGDEQSSKRRRPSPLNPLSINFTNRTTLSSSKVRVRIHECGKAGSQVGRFVAAQKKLQ